MRVKDMCMLVEGFYKRLKPLCMRVKGACYACEGLCMKVLCMRVTGDTCDR